MPDVARQAGSTSLRFIAEAAVVIIAIWAVANLLAGPCVILRFSQSCSPFSRDLVAAWSDCACRERRDDDVILLLVGILAPFVLVCPPSEQFNALSRSCRGRCAADRRSRRSCTS